MASPINLVFSPEWSSKSFVDEKLKSKVLEMEKPPPTDTDERVVKRRETVKESPATRHGLKRLYKILDIPADESLMSTLKSLQAKIL